MTYRVDIESAARRQMRNLPKAVVPRIDAAIRSLGEVPRPQGCIQMAGHADTYRIRVGDYRILYRVLDAVLVVLVVLVVRIGHRREVYRHD